MNSLGLNIILRMGCLYCSKQTVHLHTRTLTVREHLAEGGFSTVSLVEDTKTHLLYALKRIPCHSLADQHVAMQEVEAHKTLENVPGIIQMVDYDLKGRVDPLEDWRGDNESGEVWILFGYFRNGPLSTYLSTLKKPLPPVQILSLFHSICTSVLAMHNLGLSHRDINTRNVLLDDSLNPVLMDLGSVCKSRIEVKNDKEARAVEELAAERSSMAWRAPELFNVERRKLGEKGVVVDERVDVWSLGCLLYALMYKKSPFDFIHERGDSIPLAVVSGRVEFPKGEGEVREEFGGYVESLHTLIKKLLVVDPAKRPFLPEVMQWVEELKGDVEGRV